MFIISKIKIVGATARVALILVLAVVFWYIGWHYKINWAGASPAPTKNGKKAARFVPPWAKEAIWYQIFPERFRNGDPTNDPILDDMLGGWPYVRPANWQLHPWTSDWYKLQSWEEATEKDLYWNAGLRRYGGDLQGVLDRLDYLQDLGITAIYFNPLFEAPSLHKYDLSLYHHIDNNFGPNPAEDRKVWMQENPADPNTWRWTTADRLFLKLVQECHRRGIKVIIDGVFNHAGYTFWAFQDVLKNQQKSAYKDWFIIKKWDNPDTPENEFDYKGWYGVRDLPEIREDENGPVIGFQKHIQAMVRRWMDPDGDGDPSDGIDGWRVDTADMVHINFWRNFRNWVKAINPDAYITAEVWWEDWQRNKMFNAAPWLQGDAFDGVMNYRWADAIKKFVVDVKTQISTKEFVDSLKTICRDYPKENLYASQNPMDSHDVDRLSSQIVNPDRWYDHEANPKQNSNYNVRKPNDQERLKQKLIVGIQMTLPGAPMIYYGDEAGMWGGDDPDCRQPMVWPELQYEPEASHPLGKPRPSDEVYFDDELFDWYRKLITIRKANQALSIGEIDFFLIDEEHKILGYQRRLVTQSLFIILNNRAKSSSIQLNLSKYAANTTIGESIRDLISDKTYVGTNRVFSISLAPYQILTLR